MRKVIAMLSVLVFIGVYVVALVSFSSTITGWPRWGQLAFYLVAGVAWVLPLKPIMSWMSRAEPSVPDND